MLINETPPSVRRIDTDRSDAFAFEITGHLSAADIENVYGLLEGAYTVHDKIDVIVIVHDLEGFDWSATLKDSTLRGKTHALEHIRKCAVVGGPAWMHGVMMLLRPFLSLEMHHFDDDDEVDAAWEWIGAHPVRQS